MTSYRFAFLRIFIGIYLVILLGLMAAHSLIPQSKYVYGGLLSLSTLLMIGYQRQLVAGSLTFLSFTLFIIEKKMVHLEFVLTICLLLYFTIVSGNEPWRINSNAKSAKNLKLEIDPGKFSTQMIFEIILFTGAFTATYAFQLIIAPNFSSWVIWTNLAFFAALVFPKFIFRPKQHSPAPILFFDGVCGLCSNVVDFVFAEDIHSVYKVAALQGETARDKLPVEFRENLNTVVVLSHDGKLYQKSEAILNVLYELGGFWRLFFIFRLIPKPLTDLIYSLIAKYRYKIFGKKETCRIPTADERSKFLK